MISCKKKIKKKQALSIKTGNIKSTKCTNGIILKKAFIIKSLNDISHKVWLYLTANYITSAKNYSVIYMHDTQNLFDKITSYTGEWSADETLNKLYKKKGKSFIVVGIKNGGKKIIQEFTPYPP
jgi:predicted alpha/beta superfamily hydrolase